MSIFARKWTPRAHGGKADLFKNGQKMIESDQEMIENDQEIIENDQKSHGALIMGPKGALVMDFQWNFNGLSMEFNLFLIDF